MTMRVLYVSQYFPPEMGAPAGRVSELAGHWVAAGHRVTVLTGFPNHPTGVVPPEYRGRMRRLVCREERDGVRIVRTWLWPLPNRRPHERILNYVSFFLSSSVTGLFLRRPDVVIGTTPQLLVGLAGWLLARAKRAPFVLEVRDIWPDSITASGVGTEESPLARTLRALARFLYRRADHVVVVTPAMRSVLVERWGIPPAKVSVVENGVETETFSAEGPRERALLDGTGGFVASVIGTMGQAHGLRTVLDAAALLRDTLPEARFVFVGEGTERGDLKAEARRRRLDNVRFVPQQPRERIPSLIRGSDVCLVLLKRAEVFRTVIPTKMLEFMACACPVILGVDGQARAVLERAGAGVFVEPEDPAALAAAVVRLHREPALRRSLGENGRRWVVAHLSRWRTAEAYVGILEACSMARPHAAGRGSPPGAGLQRDTEERGVRPGARMAAVPPATGRTALVPVSGKPVLKRALDLALASVMLLASTPVVILVALAIRLEDGGPVLYAQERWGRGGRTFRAFKFRTMVNGADRDGIVQAKEGDSRITRVGRILRATGLDELPQLINIVRGNMSFVGPRALAVGEVVQEGGRRVEYEEIPGFAERLSVRPGLTGLAAVHLPRDASPRLKFAKDVEYVRRRSLPLDMRLILLSFVISFFGRWETRAPKLRARSSSSSVAAWAPAIAWAAVILVFSSQPQPPIPAFLRDSTWRNYAFHMGEYAVLAVLLLRAVSGTSRRRGSQSENGARASDGTEGEAPSGSPLVVTAVLALIVAAAFAVIDEWHQALVPGREASLIDSAADIAGAALGTLVGRRALLAVRGLGVRPPSTRTSRSAAHRRRR